MLTVSWLGLVSGQRHAAVSILTRLHCSLVQVSVWLLTVTLLNYKCLKKISLKVSVTVSPKTANVILPGLVTEYRWTNIHNFWPAISWQSWLLKALRVQNRIQSQMHPWMLVETTRVTEFEYYFACTYSVSLSCFCNLQTLYLYQILLGNFFSNFHAVCPLRRHKL